MYGKFIDPFFRRHFDLMRQHMDVIMPELNPFATRLFPTHSEILSSTSSGIFSPRIGITDDKSHLTINAELPGVPKENIKMRILEDEKRIILSGEKVSHVSSSDVSGEDSSMRSHFEERSYGSFERSFTLPKNSDMDKITAKMDNGVLEIKVPKKDSSSLQSSRFIQID
ncbi:Small heat shock protein C4 [Smittium culicis]|uniref:Small heat shock protein C4 n=1 Tax=Smittium culicis TaxID=133412 RepID=A0A1R1X4S2_9FUNG|nr:Small heat shock protein C4 [Smittium culicis]